jgi:CrcB protein
MATASSTGSASWRQRALPLALIAAGGFLGATLRHAVSLAVAGALPWGTLVVNVLGSFALGVLLYEAHLAGILSSETRLLVGTGFLSSFTTYSTFAVETVSLGQEAPLVALGNVGANYALAFLAVGLGQLVARWLS